MSATTLMAGSPGALGMHLAEILERRGGSVAAVVGPGEGPSSPAAWQRAQAPFAVAREQVLRQPPAALLVFPGTRDASPRADLAALAAAARAGGVRRIVCWSSAACYAAAPAGRPRREDDAVDGPATVLERALLAGAGDHGGVVVLRAAAVVGTPGDWVVRAMSHRALPLCRDGVLQLLHVDDAVEVLLRALDGGQPGTYNVAGDGLVRWSHALRALRVVGVGCPLRLARPWLARALGSTELVAQLALGTVLDTARLKTHFGTRPRIEAREALARARDAAVAPGPASGRRAAELA